MRVVCAEINGRLKKAETSLGAVTNAIADAILKSDVENARRAAQRYIEATHTIDYCNHVKSCVDIISVNVEAIGSNPMRREIRDAFKFLCCAAEVFQIDSIKKLKVGYFKENLGVKEITELSNKDGLSAEYLLCLNQGEITEDDENQTILQIAEKQLDKRTEAEILLGIQEIKQRLPDQTLENRFVYQPIPLPPIEKDKWSMILRDIAAAQRH